MLLVDTPVAQHEDAEASAYRVCGGATQRFDGGCQGLPNYTCTSAALPGTVTCVNGPSICYIQICSGSTCP